MKSCPDSNPFPTDRKLGPDPRTQAYVAKRIAEGHSKLEAIRCVKRYIAREVFFLLSQRRREINQGQAAA